jgi:excisionase family DNA binding protein
MSALIQQGTEAAEAVRLLSIKEACRILGLSRTTLYAQMASGRLQSVTVGRRRFVPREAIDVFIADLPTDYGGRHEP